MTRQPARPPDDALARMVQALRDAVGQPPARAGGDLASAGWAVFPVPPAHDRATCPTCFRLDPSRVCRGKHDQGSGALTYGSATTSRIKWISLATAVMERHLVRSVNVAVSPWRCAVPLVGLDLDGPEAVSAFMAEYGTPDLFRVVSSGKGGGQHIYVAGATEPPAGTHRWGGEIRADRGHLVLPPSIVDGRGDYYQALGHQVLQAGSGVLQGLGVGRGGPGAPPVNLDALEGLIARLTVVAPTGRAQARLEGLLVGIREADEGGRYPAMRKAVASAVAFARQDALPLRWALERITETYAQAVAGEGRNPHSQVLEMAAWAIGQETAR